MKLVAKNGRLLEKHPTTLSKEQLERFKEAIHWYEKAMDKIAKRYRRGCNQDKERMYVEAVASACEETREIDEHYKKFLDGECTVVEFKEKIKAWFYKVKEAMDDADVEFRKTGALFEDHEDRR